jgi:hypothetical protein
MANLKANINSPVPAAVNTNIPHIPGPVRSGAERRSYWRTVISLGKNRHQTGFLNRGSIRAYGSLSLLTTLGEGWRHFKKRHTNQDNAKALSTVQREFHI